MRSAEEVAQRQADLSKDGIYDFSTCCKPISSCREFSFCGEFDEKTGASHATAGDDHFAYDEATCCVKPTLAQTASRRRARRTQPTAR